MKLTQIKFLLKLKNASFANSFSLSLNFNRFNVVILKSLYRLGLIQSYSVSEKKYVKVQLRLTNNSPTFNGLKIISSPSKKVHLDYKQICRLKSNNRVLLFSTNYGLMSLEECKKAKVGGILYFIC